MGKETALPKNIRQIGDIRGREKICMEDYVMTYIRKKESEEEKGYLGIFLGEKKQMEDSEYIFIRGILEVPVNTQATKECVQAEIQKGEEQQKKEKQSEKKEEEEQQKKEEQNEKQEEIEIEVQSVEKEKQEETLAEWIQKERRFYFPDWEIQGCCIIGTYPAERMEELIHALPETANLLYHLQEQEENFYWMVQGQYQRVRGYLVFYEQNKLMQEYMAEVFGDKSVEKESQPDRAIRNFREKIAQKSEQKSRSMLKLAGSFFVVTVLGVGAVVVSRMEDIQKINSLTEIEREMDMYTAQDLMVSAQPDNKVQSVNAAADSSVQSVSAAADSSVQSVNAAADSSVQSANAAADSSAQSVNAADSSAQSVNAADSSMQPVNATGSSTPSENDVQLWNNMQMENSAQIEDNMSPASETDATQTASAYTNTDVGNILLGSSAFWEDDYEDTVSQNNAGAGMDEDGAAANLETSVEAASMRQLSAAYVIKVGDTLAEICSRYYGSLERLEEICEVNGIDDANRILPGQKIVLP